MTTQNPENNQDENSNKDPVLETLMNQIKSNYVEKVELDDLIQFDKNKYNSQTSIKADQMKEVFQKNKTLIITAISSAILTILLTLIFTGAFGSFSLFSSSNNAATQKSGVAITEAELISVVAKLGTTVYWVGPLTNAKYALDVNEAGATFVRYLPDGIGIDDTSKNYLIIATYKVTAAYDAVRAAGNEQDGIGLLTADGAAVYYNKNATTNVYMAFPGQDIQIEVFDPSPGRALQLVNTSGLVRPVR